MAVMMLDHPRKQPFTHPSSKHSFTFLCTGSVIRAKTSYYLPCPAAVMELVTQVCGSGDPPEIEKWDFSEGGKWTGRHGKVTYK